MREVRERDDADVADTRGLLQHLLGLAQVLQGVELQHHVETLVLEGGEAFFQIELDHIHTAPRAGQHVVVGQFDAVAGASALCLQMGEQLAVAAAEVEHARALGHQLRNQLHVLAVTHTDGTPTSLRSCPLGPEKAPSWPLGRSPA